MEDVGAAYNAPMNVPEPPPIPGILDRFTPPPVERSGYSQPQAPSGGSNAGLPDYLSGVDHGDTSEEDLPVPPGRRKKEKAYVSTPAPTRDDDEEGRGGPPMVVILGGLGLLAAAAGAVLFVVWLALGGLSSGGTAEGPTKEGSPLEVRQDMQREPGLIGVEPKPAAQPEVPEPTPEPDAPEPAPEPAPSAQPATAPKPTPTPRPQPKPAPVAAPKPAATVGTLKVDANRRVLIKVNGQPKGFTPQRLELPPGTYKVSAVMPGQADTEKEKSVTISAPGTTVGVDFAF
jgi:pyruvate/2-oxoglutarate dehydrogenase complex dihydrolipoamide acyltransferase (E2) component